ncbi:HAD-IIIC family phosphatase [Paenibacillus sp. MER TA 81-3]|uniref:HAD-IIIC family phosphatase n=1 Tax=Paenibacillus sp. MER TA 81-3 TaxID=2939573 RepID=UPI00204241E8|nr:HAD-IIIC family phosphatase [Paenibacillus sp. MER TA 81-3]MCM3338076.1 HAD-IIIC family phosphatase [Paenibacillus sp. MER TA 81-3]
MSLFQLRLQWQKIKKSGKPANVKIAYLSTFTINPLEPYLGITLEQSGLTSEGFISPYNQVIQECLTDSSITARFQPDIMVVWPSLEDLWAGQQLPMVDGLDSYVKEAVDMADAALEASRRWQSTLVYVLPAVSERRPLGVGDANNVTGVFAAATAVREELRRKLARKLGVLLVDAEEMVRHFGYANSYNEQLYFLARIPYTEEVFHAVGRSIAQLIVLSKSFPRKLIAVDADNTLWGGVVGEDGVDGIDLTDNGKGEAFKNFQNYLLELRRAGMLIAVCSKNAHEDVVEVFEKRREMRLKKEHIASWRVGWQPKSESLRQIAEELGLGLNSFVFIDDNPVEIAEVQAALPEVACIQMPTDPSTAIRVLQQSGALDRLPPTVEDLGRAAYYEQESKRREAANHTIAPEEYRAGLGISARLFAPEAADMARFTQLVNKTNQFNLNCRRRNESELMEICKDSTYIPLLCECKDRFGDYGIVGALIVKLEGSSAELDTFVLSCRVLGRGIEEAMLAATFERLADRGVSRLQAAVEQHPRNEPAREFFATIGCHTVDSLCEIANVEWPAYIACEDEVLVS